MKNRNEQIQKIVDALIDVQEYLSDGYAFYLPMTIIDDDEREWDKEYDNQMKRIAGIILDRLEG